MIKLIASLAVTLCLSSAPAEAKGRFANFKSNVVSFYKQCAYDFDLYSWYTMDASKRVINVATGPLRWTLDFTGEFFEIKLKSDKAANVLFGASDFIELETD